MQATHIATISFIALAILMPNAKAQRDQSAVALVQAVKPITRSYPGVDVDILGIQTGMTVAQVEAIAARNQMGAPSENTTRAWDGGVQTKPFINNIFFHPSDGLFVVFFGSPANGNTSFGMVQIIAFPKDPLKQPLVSTIKASLIKKYGPPTNISSDNTILWEFNKQSRIINCAGKIVCLPTTYKPPNSGFASYAVKNGVDFYIQAKFQTNYPENTKALGLYLSIGDLQAEANVADETAKQLKIAAAKHNN